MSNNGLEKGGILLVDKPRDYSSHDVINLCRKILQTRKIGHSGTLDPMATGLLVLLVGREATRRQDFFQQSPKTYFAVLKLGEETDTWDAYGEPVQERPVPPLTEAQVQASARELTGPVQQPIPFFSAKKIAGARMYDLARKGTPMERKYNAVTVSAWEDVTLRAADEIAFTVTCSCGTYVRSLAWLLAQKLGTAGHLTQLRRLKTGGLDVKDALDGNRLKTVSKEDLLTRMLPPDWRFTPEEEARRKETARRDRENTRLRLEERAQKAAAKAARKEAARQMYEENRLANEIRYRAEKAEFLAKKDAENNRRGGLP